MPHIQTATHAAHAEDDIKTLQAAVKGERVPVEGAAEAGDPAKLRKLFKCGDAELAIGSVLEAAMCKGAILQC
jgi:hypothetical protein